MRSEEEALRRAVTTKVRELQDRTLDQQTRHADVAGRLARLRRAVGAEPGSVPEVWADTIGSLPEELWGRGDEPSRYERAAHIAITHFAVHAQSARVAVHHSDISLGSAVRRLAGARTGERGKDDPAIFRRFQALATASSRAELNHHLRSLIKLLRSETVQLDYGLLAVDLAGIEIPARANRIRLRWGRDYHRVTQSDSAGNPAEKKQRS